MHYAFDVTSKVKCCTSTFNDFPINTYKAHIIYIYIYIYDYVYAEETATCEFVVMPCC